MITEFVNYETGEYKQFSADDASPDAPWVAVGRLEPWQVLRLAVAVTRRLAVAMDEIRQAAAATTVEVERLAAEIREEGAEG